MDSFNYVKKFKPESIYEFGGSGTSSGLETTEPPVKTSPSVAPPNFDARAGSQVELDWLNSLIDQGSESNEMKSRFSLNRTNFVDDFSMITPFEIDFIKYFKKIQGVKLT